MTVIVCPPANERVEFVNQRFLFGTRMPLDGFLCFLKQRLDAFLRWFHQQFASVLAYVLAEEVKALRYVNDFGLLFRELQAPGLQKLPDGRECLGFERLLACARHHKVVCITNDVELCLSADKRRSASASVYGGLQPIQRHIC